ncbi:MAG TPA: hypothetical protein VF001_09040 [Candidatus Limnocylindria bacterium]
MTKHDDPRVRDPVAPPLPSIIVIAPALTPLQIATPPPVPTIGFVPRPDLLIPPAASAFVAPRGRRP